MLQCPTWGFCITQKLRLSRTSFRKTGITLASLHQEIYEIALEKHEQMVNSFDEIKSVPVGNSHRKEWGKFGASPTLSRNCEAIG